MNIRKRLSWLEWSKKVGLRKEVFVSKWLFSLYPACVEWGFFLHFHLKTWWGPGRNVSVSTTTLSPQEFSHQKFLFSWKSSLSFQKLARSDLKCALDHQKKKKKKILFRARINLCGSWNKINNLWFHYTRTWKGLNEWSVLKRRDFFFPQDFVFLSRLEISQKRICVTYVDSLTFYNK